jgi:hypothetical protein
MAAPHLPMLSDLPPAQREYHLARRRTLLAELAAEERLLGIEKPPVYIPVPLHLLDMQALAKHFHIVEGERPPK